MKMIKMYVTIGKMPEKPYHQLTQALWGENWVDETVYKPRMVVQVIATEGLDILAYFQKLN